MGYVVAARSPQVFSFRRCLAVMWAGAVPALLAGVAVLGTATPVASAPQLPDTEGEVVAMRNLLVGKGLEQQLCAQVPVVTGVGLAGDPAIRDAFRCAAQRAWFALQQGEVAREAARKRGQTCTANEVANVQNLANNGQTSDKSPKSPSPTLWICFSDVSIWAQRGGTTYGNTFLTPLTEQELKAHPNRDPLMLHEFRHFLQWSALGTQFPSLYVSAGTGACENIFEQTAGLNTGGYNC